MFNIERKKTSYIYLLDGDLLGFITRSKKFGNRWIARNIHGEIEAHDYYRKKVFNTLKAIYN